MSDNQIPLTMFVEHTERTKRDANKNMASIIRWENAVEPIQPFPHDRDPLKVGDYVYSAEGHEGTIEEIYPNGVQQGVMIRYPKPKGDSTGRALMYDEVKTTPWTAEEKKAYFDWRIKENHRVHNETQQFNKMERERERLAKQFLRR